MATGMGTLENGREKFQQLHFITIIAFVILALATIFQIAALASDEWVDTVTDDFGIVGYNGLWRTCTNFGTTRDSCRFFQWTDSQISHWFRYVQTTELLGFIFGTTALIVLIFMHFVESCQENGRLRAISIVLLILAFLLIIIADIVIGSLKDVQKAIENFNSEARLSWGFGISITASLLYLASSVAFCISPA